MANETQLAAATRIVDLALAAVRSELIERLAVGGLQRTLAAADAAPTTALAAARAPGNPLEALRATDEDRQAVLDAAGETWTRGQVMRHLGVGEAVLEVLELSALVGLQRPDTGEVVYPAWQFAAQGLQPWLKPVAHAFQQAGSLDPWVRADLLLSENVFLQGRVPLEVLMEGGVDAVVQALRRYGQHVGP